MRETHRWNTGSQYGRKPDFRAVATDERHWGEEGEKEEGREKGKEGREKGGRREGRQEEERGKAGREKGWKTRRGGREGWEGER